MDENEIVKGCLRNDRVCQKALYDNYFSPMLGVCSRYSNSEEQANDILHDGFLKVFMGLKNFNNSGTLEGWVRRIMVNTCIDRLRRSKENYNIVSTVHPDQIIIDVPEEIDNEDIFRDIEKKDILKAVRKLTPAYRTVFNLYVIEDYSHQQIADMLEISEGTSKSNLSKAKFNLRKNLIHLIKTPDEK